MATILVVDDSITQRKLVGSLLEKRLGATRPPRGAWTVAYAGHGKEALDFVERQRPDLILTDLFMPGIDGLQLVEQLKKTYPTLPVILMTGYGSEELAMQALARGAVGYVPKHKLPKFLVDTVDDILAMAEEPARGAEVTHGPALPLPTEAASSAAPAATPPPRRYLSVDDCWMHTETYYRLPNDPAMLTAVIGRLQASLRRIHFCDQNSLLRICVALREALTNAMVRGNLEIAAKIRDADPEQYRQLLTERSQQEPYSRRHIHLYYLESADEVRIRIRDEGPGFDVAAFGPAAGNLAQETGRGLCILRTFMDEVHHNQQGNEITLVKRRQQDSQPTAVSCVQAST